MCNVHKYFSPQKLFNDIQKVIAVVGLSYLIELFPGTNKIYVFTLLATKIVAKQGWFYQVIVYTVTYECDLKVVIIILNQ